MAVELVAHVDEVLDGGDVDVVDGGEVEDDGFEDRTVVAAGYVTLAWAGVVPRAVAGVSDDYGVRRTGGLEDVCDEVLSVVCCVGIDEACGVVSTTALWTYSDVKYLQRTDR